MATEFHFTCALDHGLHARPASAMAAAIMPLDAGVVLTKRSSGRSADVRSVLSLVALDVAEGDACVIRAEGTDAEQAIEELKVLIGGGFNEAEAALTERAAAQAQAKVPAGLQRLGVRLVVGRPISAGFAVGAAVIV